MKERGIKHLAYTLKINKEEGRPAPIFFIGAGASKTGNIPLANELVEQILQNYGEWPAIKDLSNDDKHKYSKLMEGLSPATRTKILKEMIDNAKINATHIYLAQLIKEGYADYVLTVNFDNLLIRALALYNIYPETHDLAILKDLTTTTFREKSIIYLHGQYHGLWLLNTADEMQRVKDRVPRVFDQIKNGRPWIFIGYSGSDPVFEHVKNLGRFDDELYWVGYKDNLPPENVVNFIKDRSNNAFYIKGYDSDSFMLDLCSKLNLEQPQILSNPFEVLKEMLSNINDIGDEEPFKGVNQRLQTSKQAVENAREKFVKSDIYMIQQKLVDILINGLDDEVEFEKLCLEVEKIKDAKLTSLLSNTYFKIGNDAVLSANNKSQEERIKLYEEAIETYKEAIKINPEYHNAYSNWGIALNYLAESKTGAEAERLYREAIEKHKEAIKVNPVYYNAYLNWGVMLDNLAQLKTREEAEKLYKEAIEKYKEAIKINPNGYEVYSNLGNTLNNLAKMKTGEEAEKLYKEAIEKYKEAIKINPNNHDTYSNLGNTLNNLAERKTEKEAELLCKEAIEKYKEAIKINPNNHDTYYNWGTALNNLAKKKIGEEAERLYKEAIEKYKEAIKINPNGYEVYCNWGTALSNLAKKKTGEEAERLYKEVIEKYEEAIKINPNDHKVYSNLGTALNNLAESKTGEEAERLYKEAIEKYKEAIKINPNGHKVYSNLGNVLSDLAKRKTGEEAESLYREAIEKYKEAIKINPNGYEPYCNLGNTLNNLAELKIGEEAEKLYKEAIEKYKEAIKINPNDHKVYSNLGTTLSDLAQLKEGAEDLYKEAEEKLKKGVELGGGSYNLACLYSISGNKVEALKLLEQTLLNKEVNSKYVLQDKDWAPMLEDENFINLIKKYNDAQIN